MKISVRSVGVLLLASIFLPMGIGASRGIGLSKAADGNQTFPFAESYYDDVIKGFDDYYDRRGQFSQTGPNKFGFEVYGRSDCQERLIEADEEDDGLVGAALSYQRSLVLRQIFDRPGIEAIEALPSVVVGALAGCRYTLVTAVCDAWSRHNIARANGEKLPTLQKEKSEWLSRDEAASCKAVAQIKDPQSKK